MHRVGCSSRVPVDTTSLVPLLWIDSRAFGCSSLHHGHSYQQTDVKQRASAWILIVLGSFLVRPCLPACALSWIHLLQSKHHRCSGDLLATKTHLRRLSERFWVVPTLASFAFYFAHCSCYGRRCSTATIWAGSGQVWNLASCYDFLCCPENHLSHQMCLSHIFERQKTTSATAVTATSVGV